MAGFHQLHRRWNRSWPGCALACCASDGALRHGRLADGVGPAQVLAANTEALRWGQPSVTQVGEVFLWAVPLMHNAVVTGILVAWISESSLWPSGPTARASLDMRAATAGLLTLAEEANLTNAALLAARRQAQEQELQRATVLATIKRGGISSLAGTYLREEAALVAALRDGNRSQARAVANRLLSAIYHQASGQLEHAKLLLLELMVLLQRTALEAGGSREALLAGGLDLLALGLIQDEEVLARWVRRCLDALFNTLEGHRASPDEELFQRIVRHLNEHCREPLRREEVAEALGISALRLSRTVMTHSGFGFSELVNRARVALAKELLTKGQGVVDVAIGAGFSDASYFTKVFRRHAGMTPGMYRLRAG